MTVKQKLCVCVVGAVVMLSPLFFFVSCSPRIIAQESTDSVRVEIRERIVRDTAFFAVEHQVERVVVRDTVSRLANDWAESEARVDSAGYLHHSLQSRPRVVRVPVTTVVHDTITEQRTREVVTVKVRELTPAQAAWVKIGKTLTAIIAALVLGIIAIFAVKIYLKTKGV